ncbi:type III secretion system inner membrane ring subunit SctD [Chromobacterium violaceum]|uniref:Probable type-III secretion protein n=1 Tax=Chromobacterium violaceum (strain ATCC 12472 / DSM 30191 / JCM 1249 / CCUG 213 / NBRC 12614 / NCIMB 9131 / NCTC 9757 / MK) TaxID=243365 RepID=Q7NUV1_CHRVO|nr:type III secretion system inner membrane ring subunit SctD [Chromobacterium violaceum]AAQ60266.1 probable type-III secretion protein [Chromobacterium violaceum ATCC 12472]SUX35794.1 type III secretion system protein SsaD [Chromobacterium violaceum]
MEYLFKLKWLNGPLAGRELELPAGELRLGGDDPDIALALEEGAATVLTVTPEGVTMAPPVPVWVEGLPWDAGQALPLGQAIDLAGQGLVLAEADAALAMLTLPSRRLPEVATTKPAARSWRLAGGIVLICAALATAVLLWPKPVEPPLFDARAWLAREMADPGLSGVKAEWDERGVVRLSGLCASSKAIERLRGRMREQGLNFSDESLDADTLRRQVRQVLELNGYREVEVSAGAKPDQVVIHGAIQANAAWLRASTQLRAISALNGWRVVNDRAELFGRLVDRLSRQRLLDGLSIGVSGQELLISGQLPPERARAVAAEAAAFNADGTRLKARFQNIPAAAPAANILPAAIVSVGGNANSIYVELANGMRLQQGGTLPSGYRIYALSHTALTLIQEQRLVSIPLHL